MESRQELPPRAVLLTCDDDLRNTLTEMVPVLQEHGLSCLFFVTGASLGEVSSMLWYEQLYLMFLATKKKVVNLDMVRPGSRDRALTQDEKRALWWNLVKHLSKYEANARQEHDRGGKTTTISAGRLGRASAFRSAAPAVPDAECHGIASPGGGGDGGGRSYLDPSRAVANIG